jgi:hypothetical protein
MQIDEDDIATREYAKYVLREGAPLEKRELMGHLNESVRKALERFEKMIQDLTSTHDK